MMYYGLDWLAMAASLLAVYLLGQKNRMGFLAFIAANATWIGVGVLAASYGIVVGNGVFLALNARGWWKWRAPATAEVVAGGCP